jgi:hypothetical protein
MRLMIEPIPVSTLWLASRTTPRILPWPGHRGIRPTPLSGVHNSRIPASFREFY